MVDPASKPADTSGSLTVGLRVPKSLHDELMRAASINGITVEQFILNAAIKDALNVTERDDVTLLSEEAWKKLNETMENPPEPTPLLRKLMRP